MCNNRLINKLYTKKEEVPKKEKISEWLESRPTLMENKLARIFSTESEYEIKYSENTPLYLHNGSKVYKIYSEPISTKYKKIYVEFLPKSSSEEKFKTSIVRYTVDKLKEVEEFIENSQSIGQLVNIDLSWSSVGK